MVLLPGLPADPARREDVEEVAQKLLAAIEAPIDADGRPLSVTPSIGIALFPDDGDSPTELIEHADSAMYRAKARGRANHQFFDPAMATLGLRRAGDGGRARRRRSSAANSSCTSSRRCARPTARWSAPRR